MAPCSLSLDPHMKTRYSGKKCQIQTQTVWALCGGNDDDNNNVNIVSVLHTSIITSGGCTAVYSSGQRRASIYLTHSLHSSPHIRLFSFSPPPTTPHRNSSILCSPRRLPLVIGVCRRAERGVECRRTALTRCDGARGRR